MTAENPVGAFDSGVGGLSVLREIRRELPEEDLLYVADSGHAHVLFETGLPPRWYVPKVDVRMDLLEPTEKVTHCPYKGQAQYWSACIEDHVVPDVAWSYRTPLPESEKVAGMIAFYNERVGLFIDGELEERPKTVFS